MTVLELNRMKQWDLDDALQSVEFNSDDTVAAFSAALDDSVEINIPLGEDPRFRIHPLLVRVDEAYRLYVVLFDKEVSPNHSDYIPAFDFTLTKRDGQVVASKREEAHGGSYTSYVTPSCPADLIGAMLELAP